MAPKDRWEQWVVEALKGRHLHEPSNGALRKAIALGSQLPQRKSGLAWLVEKVFDSALEPLPAGVRGAARGERRLLYELSASGTGESHQLDLRVRRQPGGELELVGQLLPPWAEAKVEAKAGRTRRTKKLGSAGEFLIRSLPGSAKAIRIEIQTADDETLVLPEVPVANGDAEPS